MLAVAILIVAQMGAARAQDYPLIDDLALTLGRVAHVGSYTEVNVAVKNDTGRHLTSIGVTCSAVGSDGEALDTAPTSMDNVPEGAIAREKAIFSDLPPNAHFECRVDSYEE